MVEAARRVHEAGYRKVDAYTPYPIEELSEALELHHSPLPKLVSGRRAPRPAGGFGLEYWASVIAYPMNIGGRPFYSWPAFIVPPSRPRSCSPLAPRCFGMLALNGLPEPYHPVFNVPSFALASRDGSSSASRRPTRSSTGRPRRRFLERHPARLVVRGGARDGAPALWPRRCSWLWGLAAVGRTCTTSRKFKPLAKSDFFADSRSARPLVAGTVARGQLEDDARALHGQDDGKDLAPAFPFPVTAAVLARGQRALPHLLHALPRAPGNGEGMVVQRGFKRPTSFHIDRLRGAPPGYFFDVMTNGFGAMPTTPRRFRVDDRWAIVAYIRALQLSQHATARRRARVEARASSTPAWRAHPRRRRTKPGTTNERAQIQVPPQVDRLQKRASHCRSRGPRWRAPASASQDPAQFFRSYLFAFLFWSASRRLPVDHDDPPPDRRAWGLVIRRILEAGTRTLRGPAVLFLPIVFGMHDLYSWSRADVVAGDPVLRHKSLYLNPGFFLARAGFYFASGRCSPSS